MIPEFPGEQLPTKLAYLKSSMESVLGKNAWHKVCSYWHETIQVNHNMGFDGRRPVTDRWQEHIGQILPKAAPLFPFDQEFYAPGEYRNRVFKAGDSWYIAKRYDSSTSCMKELDNLRAFAQYLRTSKIATLLGSFPFRLNVVTALGRVLHGRNSWLVLDFQPHDFTADDFLRKTPVGDDRYDLVECFSKINSILRIEKGLSWRGFAPKNVLVNGWKSDCDLILCDFERTSFASSCAGESFGVHKLEEISFQMEEFVGVCDPRELEKIFGQDLKRLRNQPLLRTVRIPTSLIDSKRTAALLRSWFPEELHSSWITLDRIEEVRGWLRDAASPRYFRGDIYDPTVLLDSICAELPVAWRLALTRRVIESRLWGDTEHLMIAMRAVAVGLSILDLVAEAGQILSGRSLVDKERIRRHSIIRLIKPFTGPHRDIWPSTKVEAIISRNSNTEVVKKVAGLLVGELLAN